MKNAIQLTRSPRIATYIEHISIVFGNSRFFVVVIYLKTFILRINYGRKEGRKEFFAHIYIDKIID